MLTEAEKILELQNKVKELEADNKQIIDTVYKVLKEIGIIPMTEGSGMKKVMKTITGLTTDAMLNPGGLKKRFEFLSDVSPLIEKYAKKYNYEY